MVGCTAAPLRTLQARSGESALAAARAWQMGAAAVAKEANRYLLRILVAPTV